MIGGCCRFRYVRVGEDLRIGVGTSEIWTGVGISKKSCAERHRMIWFERVGICCGGHLE
jgi:hypothetical protein